MNGDGIRKKILYIIDVYLPIAAKNSLSLISSMHEGIGSLASSLKGEYDKVYGPDNAIQHVVNAADKVMDYGSGKVDSIVKKLKN